MEFLKQLYIKTFGTEPKDIEILKGAGSNRKYYRFTDSQGKSVIGCVGTSIEENDAFLYLAEHFKQKNLPAPEIYAVSDDRQRYLQQDFGSRSLFDAIADGRESGGNYNQTEIALLEHTIRLLPKIQIKGGEELDWNICYPQPTFDKQNVFFDLNYFKYCFLKATNIDFNEISLEADFQAMAADLTASLTSGSSPLASFMYRDFQARNIMLDREGNPYLIDFQGGRKGPFYYDVASFLWQASARYSTELRNHLIDIYYEELQKLTDIPAREEFDKNLAKFVFFRLLQVLGAYGFRGYFERKKHFIDSIPPALESLKNILFEHSFGYSHLEEVLKRLISELLPSSDASSDSTSASEISVSPRGTGTGRPDPNSGSADPVPATLTVRITSFSFKKGIPQDPSGNGGGYVFDCRSTHNPGRYAPYKKITGLDERVIKFLEDDGEIVTFLQSVYKLADFHIERYLQRGFSSLMFSFGCTGGQHRSVYSAQHLADRIRIKYPQVKVELLHREQEKTRALIFAAGLGTRLKPLTDTMPKALVPVAGKTLLERTITTLKDNGIDSLVVNVHHFSDQIKNFVAENKFGCDIRISDETDKLLDTGGGLLKAKDEFNGVAPVLIHNVDIISNANLIGLQEESKSNDSVATLLVSNRETSRYLIFNKENELVGWKNMNTGELKGPIASDASALESDSSAYRLFAFSGIHIVKQSIFPLLEEYARSLQSDDEIPKFGIIDFYLWACSRAKIKCLVQNDLKLTDVGKLNTLEQINQELA